MVLIGDYRGQCPQPPKNLHFLGLKPQASLPAYLAHADVALIPWRVGPITQATDPIKVYEYLAMQLPVLAPRLEPLITIPGVVIAKDSEDFIQLAGSLSKETFDRKSAADFVSRNTWQERVRVLLEALEKIPPGKHGRR